MSLAGLLKSVSLITVTNLSVQEKFVVCFPYRAFNKFCKKKHFFFFFIENAELARNIISNDYIHIEETCVECDLHSLATESH